ncbi:Complement component C8 alpha chain [Saguinus oedipus]|uniref:Complement component C8 alpha chain n=1 Tax=Saguinus oedipus TaxID=9490 RepID=A0ABQ9VD56_SAGOE|nr:Complement component C8 alpha chain [Saguinus oedipus]
MGKEKDHGLGDTLSHESKTGSYTLSGYLPTEQLVRVDRLLSMPGQKDPPLRRRQSWTGREVDCIAPQLTHGTTWKDCTNNSNNYRYRSLLQPNKFGGNICSGDVWDQASCSSPTTCVRQEQCGQDFQCKETGRCLKRHLLCNGELDCLDGSDEDDCEDVRAMDEDCTQYEPIPGSQKAALGYNILTREDAQSVYDARYFGGQCETVYNGEWRELRYDPTCERLYYGDDEKYFRKPYNFLTYHFEALADTEIASELYDNVNELFSKVKKDNFDSLGVTTGVGPAGSPVTVDVGVSGSKDASFLNELDKYNEKVQTAHFKMRRDNIMLDEGMLQSLMELPEQYNYGMYAKFINDYGTHYITSGSMGGTYEYILVLDKEKMESHQSDRKAMAVENVISRVQGGNSGWSGGLAHNSSTITYRSWGRSLKYNPVVIDFEVQPIHELLRHTSLGPLEVKRQNLRRALDQYLMEFNSCRCGPCFNNGVPILKGTSCKCQCHVGHQGPACEQTQIEEGKSKVLQLTRIQNVEHRVNGADAMWPNGHVKETVQALIPVHSMGA